MDLVAFFFRSSFFSGGVFVLSLVPGMLALDLPTLDLKRLVFLCLTVCDHTICMSLG